jgi:hypothetical protein
MAELLDLPPGFELDANEDESLTSAPSLPEGFELDDQPSIQQDEPVINEKPNAIQMLGEKAKAASDRDRGFMGGVLPELASAINRGAVNIADFLTTDQINAMLSMAGSEKRVPSIGEIPAVKWGAEGGFMKPGLGKDIVSAAGEMVVPGAAAGGVMRQAARSIPAATTTAQGVIKQMGTGTAGGDVALSGIAGAGSEIGEEVAGDTGALVGSILAPTAASGVKGALSKLVGMGGSGIKALMKSTSNMSEEGASTLLADAMVREGISPDDVAKKMADLGPEAIPADIGTNFARLLRVASNKIPTIEGRATEVLNKRSAGQGKRILKSLDDSTGTSSLDVDDEITRINESLKPKIDELYKAAREKSIDLLSEKPAKIGVGLTKPSGKKGSPKSKLAETNGEVKESTFSQLNYGDIKKKPSLPIGVGAAKKKDSGTSQYTEIKGYKTRLDMLLGGENVTGAAKKAADIEIKAKHASGETVTPIDVVDAHKRAVDDIIKSSIREGKTNKARAFVKIKKSIVDAADKLIPEYKEARSTFAGKASLEDAADSGYLYNKMTVKDVRDITETMGASEKKFFVLGAKKAILEKVDATNVTSDLVKRLFGKNGDVRKLSHLFDEPGQFEQFKKALRVEANFNLTRRAAQANSTTVKQLEDSGSAEKAFSAARDMLSGPMGAANFITRIMKGLSSKKGEDAYIEALEKAGDVLLMQGMNPAKLERIIRKGSAKKIEESLKKSLAKEIRSPRVAPITSATIAQEE